ncbi:MAG: PDGLE domain-containing protein [Propioniciclava sp.]
MGAPTTADSSPRPRVFIGLSVAALVVAGALSSFASSSPDGLERVAEDHRFAEYSRDTATAASPFADYATSGITTAWLSTATAGVVGVLIVTMVAAALFTLLNRGGGRATRRD